jgi:hypothetical protein
MQLTNTTPLLELLRPLESLEWASMEGLRATAGETLRRIAEDKGVFRELVRSLADDPVRLARCEQDNQVQLLLLDDPSARYRLRLHVMPDGMHDYPHGHRYSFGSLILHGVLEQTLYHPLDWGEAPLPPAPMPIANFSVRRGEAYALHHAAVHHVRVIEGPVVTLFLRSAALKAQASNRDTRAGEHRWQRAADSTTSEGRHRPLTLPELCQVIDRLAGLNVI